MATGTRAWLKQSWQEWSETPAEKAERIYNAGTRDIRTAIRQLERENKRYAQQIKGLTTQAKREYKEQGDTAVRECAKNIAFLEGVQARNVWMRLRLESVLASVRMARVQFSMAQAMEVMTRSMIIMNAGDNFATTVAQFKNNLEQLQFFNEEGQNQIAFVLDDIYGEEAMEEELMVDQIVGDIMASIPQPVVQHPVPQLASTPLPIAEQLDDLADVEQLGLEHRLEALKT